MVGHQILYGAILVVVVSGCGGGDGGGAFTQRISGIWSGPLRQASCAQCNDGTTLCVGLGSLTRTVSMWIEAIPGSSPNSEAVTITVDDCTYGGIRTEEDSVSVRASDRCTGRIDLVAIEDTSLVAVFTPGDVPPIPTADCYIVEEGTLRPTRFP